MYCFLWTVDAVGGCIIAAALFQFQHSVCQFLCFTFCCCLTLLRATSCAMHINDWHRIGHTVRIKWYGRFMLILSQMQFQRMHIFRGIIAILTPILIHIGMRFQVGIQHGLIDARVRAFGAFEWLFALVIAQMIFVVMLEFRHKRAFGAANLLLRFDVLARMFPEIFFRHTNECAVLAFVRFHFAMRIDFWFRNFLIVIAVQGFCVIARN